MQLQCQRGLKVFVVNLKETTPITLVCGANELSNQNNWE
jgi:hypothetical protein